jgi:outer membrane protein OmpA-like peptidoglycan-associated protein
MKRFVWFLSVIAISILFVGCGSNPRLKDFELQNQIFDAQDTSVKKVYLSSTVPIDSADPNKLIVDIFRTKWDKYPDTIKLYARVYDSLGRFVTNMADPHRKDESIKYFTGITEWLGKIYNKRIAEVPVFKVREFGAGDSIPFNICLNIDYSGSMSAVKNMIFEATELFVNLKQPYDNLAITTFNKDYSIKVPFMNDKASILNMYKLKRNDGFGLFSSVLDAANNSIRLFEEQDSTIERVMIVFSDGDDNYSKNKIGDLIERAVTQKVTIFTVGFGYAQDDNLQYMAKYTGGKYYKVRSKEELLSAFREIYNSLRFHYYITYMPPKFWGYHKVLVHVNAPGRTDTLNALTEYDTSPLYDFLKENDGNGKNTFTRPILFDFNSSIIKVESFPIIDEIVDAMMVRPQLKLEVQGHTDNIGTIEYNQKLSEARAKAVYDALVQRGIETNRLRFRGFGMSVPVASNETDEGRAKNRRTQFLVLAR